MKSGRTQVEIIALYEELGSYRAVGALLATPASRRSTTSSLQQAHSARPVTADLR